MDPECCWNRLLNRLIAGNVNEARDAAKDLANWIDKGGFMPNGMKAAVDNMYIPGMGIKLKDAKSS
jgi:hypothetical protein